MNCSVITKPSPDGIQKITAERDNISFELEKERIDGAWTHQYKMTDFEIEQLQSCFPRQYVYFKDAYKECSHPILGALNDFANEKASEFIKQCHKRGARTLSIGDSVSRKIGAMHNCLLLDSTREFYRVASGNYDRPLIRSHAIYGTNSYACTSGSQNCDYRAEHAVAVHSIYDISCTDMYDIFARHGLESLTSYMYFTTRFYRGAHRDPYPFFEVDIQGDNAYYGMCDESIPYKHKASTWSAWMNTTKIEGPDFHIAIEVVRSYGPLRVLNLVRVRKDHGIVLRTIPLSQVFRKSVLVPDVYRAAKLAFNVEQKDLPHYIVPENVAGAIMAYAERTADEGYRFHELATYAGGLRRRIVIGTTQFQDPWDVHTDDYHRIVISLFVLGAIARSDRTKTISQCFNDLKSHFREIPLLSRTLRKFTNRLHAMANRVQDNTGIRGVVSRDMCEMEPGFYLRDFRIMPIKNYNIHNTAIVRSSAPFVQEPLVEQRETKFYSSHWAKGLDGKSQVVTARKQLPQNFFAEPLFVAVMRHHRRRVPDTSPFVKNIVDRAEECGKISLPLVSDGKIILCPAVPPAPVVTNVQPKLVAIEVRSASVKLKVPETFLGGHCAMQTMFDIVKKYCKYAGTPHEWLSYCNSRLNNSLDKFVGAYKQSDIEPYITKGVYAGSDISACVIEIIAEDYDLKVNVHTPTGPHLISNGRISIHIYWANDHYSSKISGGGVEKFEQFVQFVPAGHSVLDVSASPGYLTRLLRSRGRKVYAAGYVGKGAATATVYEPDFVYTHHTQLWAHLRESNMMFDTIIIDAARDVNSEQLLKEMFTCAIAHMKAHGNIITKTFGNPHYLWACNSFADIRLVYESKDNSERFFRCTDWGRCFVESNFFLYYDRPGWNRKITSHNIPYCDNPRFVREFFSGAMKKYAPKTWCMKGSFEIKALTGYASASKTTEATSAFKKAVYIAPSKELSMKHQNMGVSSFTPHKFFEGSHDDTTHIIVDECFQFPVDYFSLLKTHYPNHEIICLGDVYQTPYVNFSGKRDHKTIEDYGVQNNICDVYKIPRDICKYLNEKHGTFMRTHSKIASAVAVYRDSIEKLKDLPVKVICFNGESASKLAAQGINASTITTYTGSRDAMVVFYVDSASVMSQLVNRPKYIYTAMTRAANELVIAGDTEYITRYYNIHGSKIMNYEELSAAYLFHQIVLPKDDVIPVTVARGLAREVVSQQHAESILKDTLRPINDPDLLNIGVAKVDIAPINQGRLSLPTDAAMVSEKPTKVYRLSDARFVKHQLSSNNLEAIQTLAKRYARGFPKKRDPRADAYTTKELMGGLCKALYGDESSVRRLKRDLHVSVDYICEKQAEYMDALQLKLQHNPAALDDINKPIEMGREKLNFFNKRQSKFDPKDGFDMSDKVGQGVAATSKRVNVLFCGYARGLLDRIREITVNNKRNIIIATHDSEAGLNATYLALSQAHPETKSYTCNDFSEWDASFRGCFTELTCTLLRYMGCPRYLVDDYKAFRDEWLMCFMTTFGNVFLNGMETQFSGNPFTICENTLGNMSLCFAIFKFTGLTYSMFKGDDSLFACARCEMNTKATEILSYTGHKLKLHNSCIGEFAGWFLTDEGLFPDVYRYAAKFLDKMYRDEDHFEEVKMSVQERCSVVANQSQLRVGAAVCSQFYTEMYPDLRATTFEDTLNLFHFLKGSRDTSFSSLKEQMMTSLQL